MWLLARLFAALRNKKRRKKKDDAATHAHANANGAVGAVAAAGEGDKEKENAAQAQAQAQAPHVEKSKTAKKKEKQLQKAEAERAALVVHPKRVYIMTLGVLAPYRGYGIGSRLLAHVVEVAEKRSDLTEIYLHVQVNNDDAIGFYNRANFTTVDRLENYYKRISPPHCYVVSRKIVYKPAPAAAPAPADKSTTDKKDTAHAPTATTDGKAQNQAPQPTAAEKLKKKKRK